MKISFLENKEQDDGDNTMITATLETIAWLYNQYVDDDSILRNRINNIALGAMAFLFFEGKLPIFSHQIKTSR